MNCLPTNYDQVHASFMHMASDEFTAENLGEILLMLLCRRPEDDTPERAALVKRFKSAAYGELVTHPAYIRMLHEVFGERLYSSMLAVDVTDLTPGCPCCGQGTYGRAVDLFMASIVEADGGGAQVRTIHPELLTMVGLPGKPVVRTLPDGNRVISDSDISRCLALLPAEIWELLEFDEVDIAEEAPPIHFDLDGTPTTGRDTDGFKAIVLGLTVLQGPSGRVPALSLQRATECMRQLFPTQDANAAE